MAVVFTPDVKGSGASPIAIAGGVWLLFGRLVFTGTYPALGEPLDLTKFVPAMGTVREVAAIGALRGLAMEYDVTNKKLRLFGVNPAAATLNVATIEHETAAYDADILVAAGIPVGFLVK